MSAHPWTTTEIALLRMLWPTYTAEQMRNAFQPHTVQAVREMAKRLGLRRRRDWKAICKKHVMRCGLFEVKP